MQQPMTVHEFLADMGGMPVVDVRSPAEFTAGHIPGAVNIPLFNNEERAKVGTLYRKEGSGKALLEGLDIVGPKLSAFVTEAMSLSRHGEMLVHCWRGGMRSSSFAWLMSAAGIKAGVLEGGYKAFRNWVLAQFEKKYDLVLLGGETGSGKTAILGELHKAGHQVIDLESIARHRGSAFGGLGMGMQPTIEQFENELALALSKLDGNRRIWVEDESSTIGKVVIPHRFYALMKESPLVKLAISRERRIGNLVRDYGSFSGESLTSSILRIGKKLGGQRLKQALEELEKGNLSLVAATVLDYYDRSYDLCIERNRKGPVISFPGGDKDEAGIARSLVQVINSVGSLEG